MQMLSPLRQAEHECAEVVQTVSYGPTDDRPPRRCQHDRRLLQTFQAAPPLALVLPERRRVFVIPLDGFPMMPRPETPGGPVQPRAVHRFHEVNPVAFSCG